MTDGTLDAVTHEAFASPLSLVQRWRELPDGPPLREMVVLGYTLDLAFLERVCLPQARQLGARVTVLADGGQSVHDAVDVRLAGRFYQHGLTATKGAFHPKLAVLLGDHQAWAAIGSGNPTMAGWGHNHELWCVIRGSRDRGPRVQAELGTWLHRLPETVPMPSWIADTLRDVSGRLLPATVDDAHADVGLLHNLDRPIVEQLGFGPVEELRLAAPFLDPSGGALRNLIERSSPHRLRIALQPTMSSFDGRALVDAVRAVDDVAFVAVDDARTLHGKLIEWTSPAGATTAVVGSPNLTSAALSGTVADGHNCELAVRAPVRASLLPAGQPLEKADITDTTWNRPDIVVRAGSALRLLGCRRDEVGLVVELVCRHAVDVTVETSVNGSPGSWQPKAVMPAATIRTAGITTVPVVAPEVSGGAVRAAATVRGTRVESAPVFVTDVVRCRPKSDPGHGPQVRDQDPVDEVLAESALARRFHHDVLRLLDYSAQRRAVPIGRTGGVESVTVSADDRWQRFLDRVEHALGTNLTALVYPGARTPPSAAAEEDWVVGDVQDESELAEGETDDILDDEELFPPPPRVPLSEHGRQRSWMRKWVTAVRRPRDAGTARPALELRLLIASLSVNRLAAGIWGTDDGWRVQLADLVETLALGPADEVEEEDRQQGYLASWVAVCLTLLLQDVSLHGGREADVVAQRAWNAGHALAARADPSLVANMIDESSRSEAAYARVTTEAEVLRLAALAREQLDDPLAARLAGLAADGLDVERRDGAWIVHGSFKYAARPAARVLTELCLSGAGAVVATNGKSSAVMVRRGDVVMVAESAVRVWKTFRIRPPMTPASLFRGGESAPRADRAQPLHPLPAELTEAGMAAQVDVGALVAEFLSRPRARSQWETEW